MMGLRHTRKVWPAVAVSALVLAGMLTASPALASAGQAPRNVAAQAGSTGGTATVTWARPTADAGLLGYSIVTLDARSTEVVPARAEAPASSTGPVTISGLSNGQSYTFIVYAVYATESVASTASSAVVPFTTPGPPGTPTAERASAGALKVTWSAPADNGGSAITSYTVECAPACGSNTANTTEASITGLQQDVAYTVTVRANNARGASQPSAASASVTPFGLPSAPTGVQAVAGAGQAVISWDASNANGSTISGYTATATRAGDTAKTCNAAAAATSCTIQNLTDDSTYSVSVVAGSNAGNSPASSAVNVTPVAGPSPPDAPRTVNAARTNISQQVQVTWTAPANDNGSAVIEYEVSYSRADSAQGWTVDDTTGPGARSLVVDGLENGTPYLFRVRARNAINWGPPLATALPGVAPATTPLPPTGVTATAGNGQATVSWVAVTGSSRDRGSAVTSYAVTASPQGTGNPCQSVTGGTVSCVMTGLTNGTAYTFTVRATNGIGQSDASVASTPVTPTSGPSAPGAPATLTATRAGSGSVTLTWTAPDDTGGSAITNYQISRSTNAGATFTVDDTVSAVTLSKTISGLANGTPYVFRVTAKNSGNANWGTPRDTSLTPATTPSAPTNLSATAGDGRATITFTAGFDGGVAITNYKYRIASQSLVALTPADSTSPVTISGLTNGTTYSIKLVAVNEVGDGVESSAVSVTPTSGGGGGGGGSASPSPSPTSSPSPSPSPTTSPSPSPSPSPTQSPSPKPTPGPSGGVAPADPAEAERLPVAKPPAKTPGGAPLVRVERSDVFQLIVRGLPKRATFQTQIREGGNWVTLDRARSSNRGALILPALEAKKLGEYLVRMRPSAGPAYFIKVVVTRPVRVARGRRRWGA